MKTLEDLLIEREEDASGVQPCPQCEAETALFSLVILAEEPDEYVCGKCYLESVTEQPQIQPWDTALGEILKGQRNQELDRLRWTIMPDSPLTESCKTLWLAYLNSLHRMTVDFTDPVDWVWGEQPPFVYK